MEINTKKFTIICLLIIAIIQFPIKAQTWHGIGKGVGEYGYVSCLKIIEDTLYVGGAISKNWGAPGNGIVSFDGTNWDSLGCSIGIGPFSMDKFTDNNIYIGGNFSDICNDNTCYNIAKWNDSTWEKVSTSVPNNSVNAVKAWNNELYIGGEFTSVGSTNVKRIARWNGTSWHDVGGGVWDPMPYSVHAMAIFNGELIVGGYFTKAGNDTVNNIAAWDGSQWHSLSNGVNSLVWSLYTDTINNLLYAGGNFTMADTVPVKYIACWDGQKWSALKDTTNNFHGIAGVFAITRFNNKIYAGGTPISNPPSAQDTILACWDGTSWAKVLGPNSTIRALTVFEGNMYVGGDFTSIDWDTAIKYIACYGDNCPCNVGINEVQSDKTEYLWQNIPNPFNNTTTIPYYMPEGGKGSLQIIDVSGKLMKEYNLLHGKNKLDVSLAQLKSGVYFYSIFIDGVKKQTLKMLVN